MSAGTPLVATGVTEAKSLVRSGPCHVTGVTFVNEDSAARFLQVFDAAAVADVTLATTKPALVLAAAQNTAFSYPGGAMSFQKGVVVAATTAALGNTGAAADKCHAFVTVE